MKNPIYITTIKLDYDWDHEIIATSRPFTKEESANITQNVKGYKIRNPDWRGSPCDMLDYAVLSPFKSIIKTIEQTNIQVLC